MAIIEHLWVAEKATVTGTGSITLPGTPFATGDITFVSAYASGDQLPYVIRDGTTGAQEAGIGTISIASGVATLARTVVIESSNANALVNFAGNSCSVWVDKLPGVKYVGVPTVPKPPPGIPIVSFPLNPSNPGNTYGIIHQAGVYQRQPCLWLIAGDPVSFGINISGSNSGNWRLGLYEVDNSTGRATNLLYDSGSQPMAGGLMMGAVVPPIKMPSFFYYDITCSNNGVSFYGASVAWFYGIFGMGSNMPMYNGGDPVNAFPNPCNYDSAASNSNQTSNPFLYASF